jgi:hypothetical protein
MTDHPGPQGILNVEEMQFNVDELFVATLL